MRIGRIPYINCYPIYGAMDRGLVACPGKLVTGTPTDLNNLLAAAQLDVSVVSAVEYARNAKAYHLLPDLAISCDGPVRSVTLFAKRPVSELDGAPVLVSSSSRTSVHLLELLCAERWGVHPTLIETRAEPGDLSQLGAIPHEAVMVIGDAALMLAAAASYAHQYDLGAEWKGWTGLPFVFAVWAARREAERAAVTEVHEALLASREWGLGHLDTLADAAASVTAIGVADCREYLSGLDYALSYRHLEGLTSFFRRLAARGVVGEGTVSFLSVA